MVCPKCKGKGHIFIDGKWVLCDCVINSRLEEKLSKSGVCLDYLKEDKKLNNTRAMIITRQFIDKIKENGRIPRMGPLYFSSDNSEYFAARYIKAALSLGFSAQILNLQDLIDLYFNREQSKFSSEFSGVDLLGLRIGLEIPNSVAAMVITNVIYGRRLQGKSTFVISFVPKEQFASRYTAAVNRILLDSKQFVPIEVY